MLLKVGRSSSEPCAAFHFRQPLQPSAGVLVSAVSPSGGVIPSHSVKMPLIYDLNKELAVGDVVEIKGNVLASDKPTFSVNLCCTKEINQAVFHFNPRLHRTLFRETRLVMNTMKDNRWMEEIIITPFRMDRDASFTLTIKNAAKGFEVDMSNGFRYCYGHRRMEEPRFVLFIGDLYVEYCKLNGTLLRRL